MKSTIILFFSSFLLFISSSIFSMNHIVYQEDSFIDLCYVPLNFNQPRMLHHFLKKVFSNKRYAQDYLPYHFSSHLIQFLDYGKAVRQKALYMESSLRLFYNKLKSAPFVCPFELIRFLDRVPTTVAPVIQNCDMNFLNAIENKMVDIFIPAFVDGFSLFKSNPEDFFKHLAQEVTKMVEQTFNAQSYSACQQLQHMFLRFLDLGLMKLLWNPADQLATWNSVKIISQQLSELMQKGLITIDELDDFYKSLLESYCRFLDLAGSELELSVVDVIKEDILSGALLLCELDEQEEYIETKKERLLDVLLETRAKIEARMHGMITDVISC